MITETLRLSGGTLRLRLVAFWERVLRLSRHAPRRLRLCESLPLGEKRFVAVVEFEEQKFLVGGTPSSLVLLSRLGDAAEGRGEVGNQQKTERGHAIEDGKNPWKKTC